MLIQSSLPSSIQSPLSFVSDHGKQQNSGPPSDWTHCDETWHESSENDKCPWDGCRKSILTRDVKDDAAITCSIDHSRTHSNSSAIEDMSASSPKRNDYVYKRRRKNENSFAPLSSEAATDNMKGETQEVRADVPPVELCKGDLLENGNAPSCQNHHPSTRIDDFGSVEIISKSDSIDDSCCSSKSNVEHGLAFVKIEEDEAAECSSSDIVVTELLKKNPLEKDLSISTDACAFVDILGIDASCSQPCKICGILDKPLKMLICDLCEEAFHLSCCNPRVKKIPVDEWYCQSCIRKRPKPLFETTTGGISSNIMGEMSEYRKKFLRSGGGIISFMLKDTEPYTTGVRIGKAFQADVPDWSGPISEDPYIFDEPLEVDPTESLNLNVWNAHRSSSHSSIGNWLQCREVIDEDDNGEEVVCGKWRRAPLFEVQTDDWDCSCAVLWDPIHSDCAVPQELRTEEVLMHLKYIEVLRPRLAAKAQKQTHIKTNGSE